MRPPRSRSFPLRAALFLLPIPFLTGCYTIEIRELRTEKKMLQARVMQLQQDMGSMQEKLDQAEAGVPAARPQASSTTPTAAPADTGAVDALKRQLADATSRENSMKMALEEAKSTEQSLRAQVEDVRKELGGMADRDAEVKRLSEELEKARKESGARASEMQTTLTQRETAIKLLTQQSQTLGSTAEEMRAKAATLEAELAKVKSDSTTAASELANVSAERDALQAKIKAMAPGIPAKDIEDFKGALEKEFAAPLKDGNAFVDVRDGQVVLTLQTDWLFKLDTTIFSASGLDALSDADALKNGKVKSITVAGHTDSSPPTKMPYADNWEVAAARAAEVARFLVSQAGHAASTVTVASHGESRPNGKVAPARNRRVEITFDFATN